MYIRQYFSKEDISSLESTLYETLYVKNVPEALTRLCFLKYAIDNKLKSENEEDSNFYEEAQQIFLCRDNWRSRYILLRLFDFLDEKYKLRSVLSSRANISEYERLIFESDREYRRKYTENIKNPSIAESVTRISLEETPAHNVGKALSDYLRIILSKQAAHSRTKASISSRDELGKLARSILRVTDNDTLYDYAGGIGNSTLVLTEGTDAGIRHFDIDENANSIAAMLYILSGKKDFIVRNYNTIQAFATKSYKYDFYDFHEGRIIFTKGIDKYFVDSPTGIRIGDTEDSKKIESGPIVIEQVASNIAEHGGLGIVTCHANFLFGRGSDQMALRQKLLSLNILKAVIALPPLGNATSVGTNLVVLSNENENNERNKIITFIDAKDMTSSSAKKIGDDRSVLNDDRIMQITSAFYSSESIPHLSKKVWSEEISGPDYLFTPELYVEKQIEENSQSVADIDRQLGNLYNDLLFKKRTKRIRLD